MPQEFQCTQEAGPAVVVLMVPGLVLGMEEVVFRLVP